MSAAALGSSMVGFGCPSDRRAIFNRENIRFTGNASYEVGVTGTVALKEGRSLFHAPEPEPPPAARTPAIGRTERIETGLLSLSRIGSGGLRHCRNPPGGWPAKTGRNTHVHSGIRTSVQPDGGLTPGGARYAVRSDSERPRSAPS